MAGEFRLKRAGRVLVFRNVGVALDVAEDNDEYEEDSVLDFKHAALVLAAAAAELQGVSSSSGVMGGEVRREEQPEILL